MEEIIEKMKEIRDIKKANCYKKCDECILYKDLQGFKQLDICDVISLFDYDVEVT